MSFGRAYVSKSEIVVSRDALTALSEIKDAKKLAEALNGLAKSDSEKAGRCYVAASEVVMTRSKLTKLAKLSQTDAVRVSEDLAELGEYEIKHASTREAVFEASTKNGRTYVGVGETVVRKAALQHIVQLMTEAKHEEALKLLQQLM